MGVMMSKISQENKHNFQISQIEKKAGSKIMKSKSDLNFWSVIKTPISFLAGILSFIIGKNLVLSLM